MVIPNRTLYALSFAAVLCLAAAWLPLTGCAKKTGQEAAPETSDTLSAIADTLPQTPVPLTDGRDGKTYRTVVIGGKTWMAQNLNYKTGKSWCYDKEEFNCGRYGRLYDWNTAMKVCPAGWHLPSRTEWDALVTAVGGNPGAGTKLKSTSGWNNRSIGTSGNGTNEYGFSALSGGTRYSDGCFTDVGHCGGWWAASEINASTAYTRGMFCNRDYVRSSYDGKSYGWSVRCVGD